MSRKNQSGSIHLIVIAVLVLSLLGALGFVFWQNFIVKNNQSQETQDTTQNVETAVKYKTFTDETYGLSFQYPENWALGEVNFTQPEMPYYNREMNVMNENGETMATLVLGVSGLGGTCSGIDESDVPSYTVLDSETSSIKAKSEVAMDFIVHYDEKYNRYNAYYGLSDTYTSNGDYEHVCLFYNVFNSGMDFGENIGGGISFGNGVTTNFSESEKRFSSLEDINKYLASDEYKEIKKMLLSLSF